jgi:hypothetical protein
MPQISASIEIDQAMGLLVRTGVAQNATILWNDQTIKLTQRPMVSGGWLV